MNHLTQINLFSGPLPFLSKWYPDQQTFRHWYEHTIPSQLNMSHANCMIRLYMGHADAFWYICFIRWHKWCELYIVYTKWIIYIVIYSILYTRYDMDCIPYVDLFYKTKIIFRSIHKMRFLPFFIQMFLAISNIQAASVRLSDPRWPHGRVKLALDDLVTLKFRCMVRMDWIDWRDPLCSLTWCSITKSEVQWIMGSTTPCMVTCDKHVTKIWQKCLNHMTHFQPDLILYWPRDRLENK